MRNPNRHLSPSRYDPLLVIEFGKERRRDLLDTTAPLVHWAAIGALQARSGYDRLAPIVNESDGAVRATENVGARWDGDGGERRILLGDGHGNIVTSAFFSSNYDAVSQAGAGDVILSASWGWEHPTETNEDGSPRHGTCTVTYTIDLNAYRQRGTSGDDLRYGIGFSAGQFGDEHVITDYVERQRMADSLNRVLTLLGASEDPAPVSFGLLHDAAVRDVAPE